MSEYKSKQPSIVARTQSSPPLIYRSAVLTLKLVNATRESGSLTERMKATCALLKEDNKRAVSWLDMSLLVDGEEVRSETTTTTKEVGSVCAFFHLIRLYATTGTSSGESADTTKIKVEAQNLFGNTVLPLLPRLLCSFDPSIVDPVTGNNALHEILSHMTTNSEESWLYKFIKSLLQHGVSLTQRNNKGETIALTYAHGLGNFKSACGLHLLLRYGANINAQDSEGDTMLHHLIRNEAWSILQDICEEGDTDALDLFLVNKANQTIVDLAAIKHAQKPNDANCSRIHAIVRVQMQMWQSRIRPAVLSCLSDFMIPDLSSIVIGYVDGSGNPFAAEPIAAAEDHE